MNGAYYELIKPVKDFVGKHSINFTGYDRKQYKEEFSFKPMRLRTKLPALLGRDSLSLELEGVEEKDYVRIVMTDTVMFSEGIVRMDTVRDGRLHISRAALDRLADGPIHFQLFKEEERRIRNGTKEGGRISISYGLRREFELKGIHGK
jgi:hypothetical protein